MDQEQLEKIVRSEVERINDESKWVNIEETYRSLDFKEAVSFAENAKKNGWKVKHIWTTGYDVYEVCLSRIEKAGFNYSAGSA